MIYTKYMPGGTLQNASRNKRELQTAEEAGFDIKVVSSDNPVEFEKIYPKYQLILDQVVKLNYRMPRYMRCFLIVRNFVTSFMAIWKTKSDIISCHDIDSLFKGWFSNIFKRSKAKLIYDSHEFEIGRNVKRNKLQLCMIIHMERFLIKRCAMSIMVNDTIADEVQRIHKIDRRPIVVRSTPDLWLVDPVVCRETRQELYHLIEAPTDFMLMYHGAIVNGRGVEKLLNLVKLNNNVCLVILGMGSKSYITKLMNLVRDLDIQSRVCFHTAVPIEELWKYVGAADVGMITIPATSKSYYYMLPNKFFENIQSETPVICSGYPAIKPIVEKYNIGLTCDPTDLDEINACVEKMRTDKAFYTQCKENLKFAKQDLCWENEKKVLKEALKGIIDE